MKPTSMEEYKKRIFISDIITIICILFQMLLGLWAAVIITTVYLGVSMFAVYIKSIFLSNLAAIVFVMALITFGFKDT